MGRWIVLQEDDFVRDNSDGWCGACASEADARHIAKRHKRDCDTYEARIAELEAKLDWAQQTVKAQAETSNGVACAEERAAGNGGCGACSWCCSQWRERAEVATAELARVKAESLRVVRLPEAREHECTTATMGIIDDMIGFKDIDADWYLAPDWKNYTPETFDRAFTPVRLERWETEE